MPQCDCKAPSVMNLISFGRTRHWMHVACTVNRDRRLFVCMLLPLWCRDIRQSIHHTTKRPVDSLFCFLFSSFLEAQTFCCTSVLLCHSGQSNILCCILAGSKRRSHYDLVTLNASLRHLCFGLTFQATNLFLSSVTAQGCSVFASFRHLCPRSVETIVSWGMWGSLWIAGVLFASSCGCLLRDTKDECSFVALCWLHCSQDLQCHSEMEAWICLFVRQTNVKVCFLLVCVCVFPACRSCTWSFLGW